MKIWVLRPATLTEFLLCSFVIPGKCWDSTLKQTISSCHILSNASLTNFPIQHYIENNQNPVDRMSTDYCRLWKRIKLFLNTSRISSPHFTTLHKNLSMNDSFSAVHPKKAKNIWNKTVRALQ
jgi:hypothetical protein